MSTDERCPCGSEKPYSQCCGLYHSGSAKPPTAEALMRSRYTAFVKKLTDYLIATRHPDKRHLDSAEQLAQSFANTDWLGLTILTKEKGGRDDDEGYVSFTANYRTSQGEDALFEKSRFEKVSDQWFYVEGKHDIGRNDPCWCGSGKKYKKCHGG